MLTMPKSNHFVFLFMNMKCVIMYVLIMGQSGHSGFLCVHLYF